MAAKSKTPKKADTTLWCECDICHKFILTKESSNHSDCIDASFQQTNYIDINKTLHSKLEIKSFDKLEGLSRLSQNYKVFLSESVIQLCQLAIGGLATIECEENIFCREVWPSGDKTVNAIMLTDHSLDLTKCAIGSWAKLYKCDSENISIASTIKVIVINAPKMMQITPDLHKKLLNVYNDKIVSVNNLIDLFYYGKVLKFDIKNICTLSNSVDLSNAFATIDISGKKLYKITASTNFEIFHSEMEYSKNMKEEGNLLNNIGGLNNEITEIQDMLNFALKSNEFHGIGPPKAGLLYGQNGVGKTMLGTALLQFLKSIGVHAEFVKISDLYLSEPEESLRDIIQSAIQKSPSAIIIDDIENLLGGKNKQTELNKLQSFFICQLDNIYKNNNKIFILGITSKIECIDSKLRIRGKFEREIEIPVPNSEGRFDILKKITRNTDISEDILKEIAYKTHGFVGADLNSLLSWAVQNAYKNERNIIGYCDFKYALSKVIPSAMKEVHVESPNVYLKDIGGQEKLKLILRQCVEWPLKHPESFIRMGITPPRGVLMYGPPGCSKTMIAKALATESGLNFLSIKGPELFSKWVGESERAVREVFRKARQVAPAIIFFDEIDALGGERSSGSSSAGGSNVQDRVLAQLLTELDGITPLTDVTIIAATNRPDRIDKALLRPGRLDRIVYVPLPDSDTRRDMLNIKFKSMPIHTTVNIDYLVLKTDGYSGAEVGAVCDEAAMTALEESLNSEVITMDHFNKALMLVTPRTPQYLIDLYEEYNKNG